MPSGTLAISKTRTPPVTYRVSFVPYFAVPRLGLGALTITTLDELRAFLFGIGVVGRDQEDLVRAAIRDGIAVVRDVVLTDTFISEHRL